MNRAALCILALSLGCGHPAPGADHAGHAGHVPAAPVEEEGDMPGMPGMKASAHASTDGRIEPTAAAAAQMGLTVAPVRAGTGQVARRAPAYVTFDPASSVQVTTQAGGQVVSLAVPAPGGSVTRGQVLARLYDPARRAVLEDVRVARTLDEPWRAAAASRARASGIEEAEIRAVAEGGAVPDTFPVRSPVAGVVSGRPVSQGAWVAPGGVLAVLVDAGMVLVDVVVDGATPVPGTAVVLRDLGAAGATTGATVVGPLPEASAAGVRVRVQALGPVTPGRPLVAEWTDVTAPALWVPASALVDTGVRRVVFVQDGAAFVPRQVEPGVRAGDEVEIRTGLSAGESVAASAAFLLDSETQVGSMAHAGHGAP